MLWMASSISSIRIPDELRYRLERTAKYLKKGKNWIIINQALDEYLRKVDRETLASLRRGPRSVGRATFGKVFPILAGGDEPGGRCDLRRAPAITESRARQSWSSLIFQSNPSKRGRMSNHIGVAGRSPV